MRKRTWVGIVTLNCCFLLASSVMGQQPASAEKQPVGVQFRINMNYFHDEEMAKQSCKNLRRYLEMFKKYRVKSDFLFTGLAAEQINRMDPEFISMLNEAKMPINHHGANRPPRPEPVQRVKGEDWNADAKAIIAYESHKIDPKTGELDFSQEGGLKMMQKLFNDRILVTGRFFQASILYAEKQFGCKAMVGLGGNTGAESNSAWFMGMMNMPEEDTIAPERVKGCVTGQRDLIGELNEWIAGLDRSQFHTLAIPVHDFDLVGSTGGGPAAPGMPVVIDRAELEKLWGCFESLVKWAATNPEVKVITTEDVLARIIDDRNRKVNREYMSTMAAYLQSLPSAPPDFFPVGTNDYLSLADGFQAFAAALKAYKETGSLPTEVETHDVLGPTSYGKAKLVLGEEGRSPEKQGPGPGKQAQGPEKQAQRPEKYRLVPESQEVNLTTDGSKVIEAAAALNLSKEIPASVMIGEQEVNPAIFLHLMARIYTNLVSTGQPGTVQFVGKMNVLPEKVQKNRMADPLTKLQFWTYKPERFKSL